MRNDAKSPTGGRRVVPRGRTGLTRLLIAVATVYEGA